MDKELVRQFVDNAIKEDVGDGDHTSLATISEGTNGKAKLLVKDEGILAGVELAVEIFHVVDPSIKLNIFILNLTCFIVKTRIKELWTLIVYISCCCIHIYATTGIALICSNMKFF